MTDRPLPPHGSYARANGSPRYRKPCNCPPCTQTRNRRKKQYRIDSGRGNSARIDATPARAALLQMRQTMTWTQITEATGVGISNVQDIASGRRKTSHRTTITKILATQPRPISDPQAYVDATGSSRRIQALRALGHSLTVLQPLIGSDRRHLSIIALGQRPTVRHHVAQRIAAVYTDLASKPAPEGWTADMTRTYAASQRWAPPAAWDDIDDPNAVPDWTGHCGTDRGWWTHNITGIPACPRCDEAHAAWLAERKHLPARERFRQLALAKGAASQRGANLAHDARELIRVVGLTVEQAAERLGVSLNHLQHELARHPDIERSAA